MKRFAMLISVVAAVFAVAVPLASASPTKDRPKGSDRGAVCGLDREWMKLSMQTDLAEIGGGKAAEAVSTNAAVLKLASTIVTDHTAAYATAAVLAKRLHIAVPTTPSATQQWAAAVLSTMTGRDFNHYFSLLQVAGHVEAIGLARDEVRYGCNADVRSNARMAIPMLEMHLKLVEAALKANP